MIQIFTLNDVVRYIYHEMSSQEADRMAEALLFDTVLLDFYQQFLAVKNSLDVNPVCMVPAEKVTNTILYYSRSYHLQETDH